MPKKVDHDKRRAQILLRALVVFQEKGFSDTNLADIAARANVSRPTLYQYFQDKDEIFHDSVKFATDLMLTRFNRVAQDQGKSVSRRLELVFAGMIDSFTKNRKLLVALFNFLIDIRGSGETFSRFLSRRTIQLKRLFVRLAIEGMRSGELTENSPGAVVSLLVAYSHSLFVQIALMPPSSKASLVSVSRLVVESLSRPLEPGQLTQGVALSGASALGVSSVNPDAAPADGLAEARGVAAGDLAKPGSAVASALASLAFSPSALSTSPGSKNQ
jgi:AcrR family transcriptional regulator